MAERYLWEIRTKENPYSGTDGQVTLTIHGSNGVTEPLQLETSDFRMGQIASGVIEADEDLGNIVSGDLQAELDPQRPWDVDFVRITRSRDGKAWVALDVGTCTEKGCPLLRFEPLDPYPRTFLGPPGGGAESQPPTDPEGTPEPASGDDQAPPGVPEPPSIAFLARKLKLALEDLQGVGSSRQQELSRRIARLVQPLLRRLLEGDGDDSADVPSDQAESFLVELYASRFGSKVQLKTVLSNAGGRLSVAPGVRVFVTRTASEGFGLARSGVSAFAPPYRFTYKEKNFEVLALDGFTAKRVPLELLVGLFGESWPEIILQADKAPKAAQ